MPTVVTNENVNFNGVLTPAAVLKNVGNVKTLVLWNNLSVADQALLSAVIDSYGGANPLPGPVAGAQTVNVGGNKVGAGATGLSNVVATAGVATINVGGNKVGGTASGLSASAGTAGYQTVNYQPGITGATATGLDNITSAATSGHQTVNVGGVRVGGDATGLVGATTYTATITVDGAARAISILGSSAATFTTLLSEINTDLSTFAVAALVGGNIRVTSATTGVASTVAITAGTLFAAPLTGFVAVLTAVAGTAAVSTTYTATITVDGVARSISVVGSAAQTFTTLVSEINTDLSGFAIASIAGGDIKVTSATVGITSIVSIAVGTLFPATANFVSTFPSANGGGSSRRYSATVIIDGSIIRTVSFTGLQGTTFTNVLSEINTDLGAAATASISGGNVVITSATSSSASSVAVFDSGALAVSLAGYVDISSVPGTSPITYTATINVDGVNRAISVAGTAAQTFTTLIAEINTDLAASATAALTGGNIVVTSATTGVASYVEVTAGNLFRLVTGFVGYTEPREGAVDLTTVLSLNKSPSGASFLERMNVRLVGLKPAVPPYVKHTTAFIYHNGTNWRYLDDDTAV